jgi:AAA family ATP:ADP antiporter
MIRTVERFLSLQRGDLSRVILLFLYLFLVIASYVIGKAARDALFLDEFKAIQLPIADIIIALLVGFIVAGYVRIGRHLSLRDLLMGCLACFGANSIFFWWLAHFHDWKWTYPIIYIWVGMFGVLAPAQVWTLANYVLTTREAKRLFGYVGGGAILGWIFGGYVTKVFANWAGTESLLLAMAATFVVCAFLVYLIWRQKEKASVLEEEGRPEGHAASEGGQSILQSLRLVASSTYLRAIAAVICISSFVTTLAGWQFKAIAKQFFPQKDALTAFFGEFNFYAGILAFVVQLLFTSRILRRFGIGPALFIVPISLLMGSVGVFVWFGLAAAIFLKGSDQVLRYSIDKPTVELLYLPVPPNIKIQVKSFIDTVIWRLGDGLAGVSVLGFSVLLLLEKHPENAALINIMLITLWLAAAWVARRQYVATLRDCIQKHRFDAERAIAPVLDRSTLDIFAANLEPTDPEKIIYALSLFEVGSQQAAHPAVRGLLNHPSPEVRRKALSILSSARDTRVIPIVEELLRDPDLGVRTEALMFLTHNSHIDPLKKIEELGDFPDFSIRSALVAFLARPGEAQNLVAAKILFDQMVKETGPDSARTRLEAARLISVLPDEFDEQLRVLLTDPDLDVIRAAIRAVGALRKRRFALRVIDRLGDPELNEDAVAALEQFGDRIVGTLRDYLGDALVPIEARREIPSILAKIQTPACARVLTDFLLESDNILRFRVISALNKLRRDHPEYAVDTQMVETVLAAEIMGHYRSYQILGTLGAELASDEPVAKALRESMTQETERIFRLLGLLFPQHDLHSAYYGLQSRDHAVHDNALEFIDNILKPQLRQILVPVLDSDVAIEDRIKIANKLVGASVEQREQAVAALVYSSDPWLKSCGAYAIGSLGIKSLEQALEECLTHEDPLLRETARQAKLRLANATV